MQTCNAILLFSVSTNWHLPPSLVTLGIKGKLKFTLCSTKQSYGCQISLRELINIKQMKYLHSKWTYHVFYLQRKIHRLARNIIAFYQIFQIYSNCFLTENTSLSHGKKQNQKNTKRKPATQTPAFFLNHISFNKKLFKENLGKKSFCHLHFFFVMFLLWTTEKNRKNF